MQARCISKLSHRSFCKPSMQRLTCYNPRSYNHCGYRPLSQRMAGRLRPHTFTYQKDLSVQRLRRRLQSSCLLRFASFGNLVVQAKGLVIGGLLSMIAAICLSTHEEKQFLQGATHRNFQLLDNWTIRDRCLE